jgi:hypothetical protein
MVIHMVAEGARVAVYQRAQPRRSAHRIAPRLAPGTGLIAALLLSLGLWAGIFLTVSSLVEAWLS